MSKNNPLFSVIIPTYNRANQLQICLESLVNQTFKNFEVLICDDGSTDNTPQVAKEYDGKLNLKYLQDTNFGGPAKPRNNGIKQASGDWIAFLDSDDWWYANKLELTANYTNNYDVIYHNLDTYKQVDKPKGVMKSRQIKTTNVVRDLLLNGGIPNSSVVVKKNIVDTVGFITEDKNFIAVEDSDYIIRIAQVTSKFKFINQSLGAYWIGNNISVSDKQIARDTALLDKHKNLLSDAELNQATRLLALKKARVYHKLGKFALAQKQYAISFGLNKISFKTKAAVGFFTSMLKIKL